MKKLLPALWTIGSLCGIGALISWGYFHYQVTRVVPEMMAEIEREIDISVPAAELAEANGKEPAIGALIINVDQDGVIRINGVSQSEEELATRLREIFRAFPDQHVVLRGDAKADFQDIIKVLDLIKKEGIWNVAFATTRPEN